MNRKYAMFNIASLLLTNVHSRFANFTHFWVPVFIALWCGVWLWLVMAVGGGCGWVGEFVIYYHLYTAHTLQHSTLQQYSLIYLAEPKIKETFLVHCYHESFHRTHAFYSLSLWKSIWPIFARKQSYYYYYYFSYKL